MTRVHIVRRTRHSASRWLMFVATSIFITSTLHAQEATPAISARETEQKFEELLTGNWGGLRSTLDARGVSFVILARSDNGYLLNGGYQRGSGHILNVDMNIQLNGEQLLGWKGSSALLHALYNSGGSISSRVGDVQMVSNLETATRMAKVYQLWFQQQLNDTSISLLLGLYDLNSEFYVTPASSLFLNGSFGVGKELSQTGTNGPSIFPNTALALRLRSSIGQGGYLQLAGIDATPGRPDNPGTPSLSLSTNDGLLLVGEGGKELDENGRSYKFAIGGWAYTRKVEPLRSSSAPSRRTANWGAYFLGETQLSKTSASGSRGLSLFARAGLTRGSINEFDYNLAAGAVYEGLFAQRLPDRLGLAFSRAHRSLSFRSLLVDRRNWLSGAETVIELTYRFQTAPWLSLQADCQQILNPGSLPDLHDATVLTGRVEFAL